MLFDLDRAKRLFDEDVSFATVDLKDAIYSMVVGARTIEPVNESKLLEALKRQVEKALKNYGFTSLDWRKKPSKPADMVYFIETGDVPTYSEINEEYQKATGKSISDSDIRKGAKQLGNVLNKLWAFYCEKEGGRRTNEWLKYFNDLFKSREYDHSKESDRKQLLSTSKMALFGDVKPDPVMTNAQKDKVKAEVKKLFSPLLQNTSMSFGIRFSNEMDRVMHEITAHTAAGGMLSKGTLENGLRKLQKAKAEMARRTGNMSMANALYERYEKWIKEKLRAI